MEELSLISQMLRATILPRRFNSLIAGARSQLNGGLKFYGVLLSLLDFRFK
jgi:hypothetical protein